MYVGEIKNGEPNGFGTHTNYQGVYVGEWKDGLKHGRGTLFWKTQGERGRTEGVWKEGFEEETTSEYDYMNWIGDVKISKVS